MIHSSTFYIFGGNKTPDGYPPKLCPFKNGAFRLTIELKVPIIPITSLDTWKVLWDTGKEYGAGRAFVIYLYTNPSKRRV